MVVCVCVVTGTEFRVRVGLEADGTETRWGSRITPVVNEALALPVFWNRDPSHAARSSRGTELMHLMF